MVVSFRGTQSDNGWDWLTDAIFFLDSTTLDPDTGGLRTVRDLGGDATADGSKKLHRGFYKAYRCVLCCWECCGASPPQTRASAIIRHGRNRGLPSG